MPITIQFEDHTDAVIAQIEDGVARQVRESAERVRAGAADHSAVLSGAQKASLYVLTKDSSGYAEAVADAREANEKVQVFEEMEAPDDPLTALIAPAVVYAERNESDHQAFVVPAAEAERSQFEAALRSL